MGFTLKTFWLHKAGNRPEEYEDAFFPRYKRPSQHIPRKRCPRFAVADGTTVGMLSGEWARLLVSLYCEPGTEQADIDDRFLQRAYHRWEEQKKAYLADRERRNKPLMWFEEPGLAAGAFSTLLGLSLGTEEDRCLHAEAVGDSCLFQVRDDELLVKFPHDDPSQFNSSPPLLCSNPKNNGRLQEHVARLEGDWLPRDRFYLMTDALACWFLKEVVAGGKPWQHLDRINGQSAFEGLVNDLRESKQIRNDDVTLMHLRMS